MESPLGLVVPLDPDKKVCGSIVYWRLAGTTDGSLLHKAWGAAQLDPALLPSMPTASMAARRALGEKAERRLLVRPLDVATDAALVREQVQNGTLVHTVELVAKANEDTKAVAFDPPTHPQVPELTAAFSRHLGQLSQGDVSGWMCHLVAVVQAVALRDTGGVYFVPQPQVATWEAMVGAIHAGTAHRCYSIPAMLSKDAVPAILTSIQREAEKEAAELENDLDTAELGARAMSTRYDRCQAMMNKVRLYEALLGENLESLQERLQALSRGLAVLALKGTGS